MLNFKAIELEDKPWVDELNARSDYRGCEYAFGTIFIWQFVYGTKIARFEDFVLCRSGKDGEYSYLYPAGSGDVARAIEAIEADAAENGCPFRMHSVNSQAREELERLFPGKYSFTEVRDGFDYIYTSESLATLKGKKLHSKRNHINRFRDNYEGRWAYEDISPANLAECMTMNKRWCSQNDCMLDDDKLGEQCAVAQSFRHFEALGFKGGLLRVDGEVVAFSMGEPLSSDTFVVHIEKAFADIQGAYPMINQQFVLANCMEYTYVNREEDTGAEGLRKAKLSYHPAILETKYSVKHL